MCRFPKPFYRPARQLWYVQLAGKQINVGPDRETAIERYYELMADFGRGGGDQQPAATARVLMVEVIDKFLDWVLKHRSAETFE
jgi:hypothetical protein